MDYSNSEETDEEGGIKDNPQPPHWGEVVQKNKRMENLLVCLT